MDQQSAMGVRGPRIPVQKAECPEAFQGRYWKVVGYVRDEIVGMPISTAPARDGLTVAGGGIADQHPGPPATIKILCQRRKEIAFPGESVLMDVPPRVVCQRNAPVASSLGRDTD